ncbi:MAG: PEP-CTERM sorting domain-containing protein [Planctomycetota bacterium]|jgi:hypothetical protein
MKKLLALVLVLAMASWASAGLVTYSPSATTIQGAETVTVTVTASGFNLDGLADIVLIDTLVTTLTGDTGVFVISNLAAHSAWDFAAGTNVTIADTDLQVTPPASVSSTGPTTLFTFDVALTGGEMNGDYLTMSATGVTSVVASDFVTFTSNLTTASGTITVPEPMTIALLGLGGLFLRRRRS